MLLWLFPRLPGFEAQDQAERDWQKDCEFDAYGSYGLSYEGFAISLIDLATACTVLLVWSGRMGAHSEPAAS